MSAGRLRARAGRSRFLGGHGTHPVILLPQELDNFDVRGTIEAFARLKRIYTLLGHPDNITMHIGPGTHGYGQDAREAMYDCFNRASGRSGPSAEPTITLEEDRTLWCTPSGQVAELKSRPVSLYTRETVQRLAATRPNLSKAELQRAVTATLRLSPRNDPPAYRMLRPRKGRGYPLPFASIYNVETEVGILAIVYRLSQQLHHSRPPQQTNRAILYVAHDSSDAELRDEPMLREVLEAEPEATLYTCDVRGLGESRPNTCGENTYFSHYGCDYFYAAHSIMLDRPYVGQRTHDVLAVLDWITSFGHADVHLVARGYGSVPASYAALLHDGVARVTLKNFLPSYGEIASADVSKWPLSSLTPWVLKRFDLTDVYRELAAKQLRLIAPRGPEGARS